MDGIAFIFKRFFYSFLSGCVINFYVIIYYYALEKYSKLPVFFDIIKSFINKNPLFIVFAILISLIIEGICQIGIESCISLFGDRHLFDKDEKGNIKNLKKFKTLNCKYKIKYIKYRFFSWYIFIRPAIFGECIRYTADKNKNPMEIFIQDSGDRVKLWHFFYGDLIYNAVHICARVIEKEGKITDIYRYRDNSYVIQMLRLSFLSISILTLISGIIFPIVNKTGFWEFHNIEKYESFFVFIIVIFVISLVLFFATTCISSNFAKRFIREVGYTYEALRPNLLINTDELSSPKIISEE